MLSIQKGTVVSMIAVFVILSLSFATSQGVATCRPNLFGQPQYGICVYNSSNNLISYGAQQFSNLGFGLAHFLGVADCYCKTDCTPQQIVCNDPHTFQIVNGLAVWAYDLEDYAAHCYCPENFAPGVNPCENIAPYNPGACTP